MPKRKARRQYGIAGQYAIAVWDQSDLFLVRKLRRSATGQVFFEWSGRGEEWDPHTSWHSSGEEHQKSFGMTFGAQQRQRPDASFKGSMNYMHTPIVAGEGRTLGIICDPALYEHVFEIAENQLHPLPSPATLAVDVTEAGGSPDSYVAFSPRILKQERIYDASTPWIWLTLFDDPNQPEHDLVTQRERLRLLITTLEEQQRTSVPGTDERCEFDKLLAYYRAEWASDRGII